MQIGRVYTLQRLEADTHPAEFADGQCQDCNCLYIEPNYIMFRRCVLSLPQSCIHSVGPVYSCVSFLRPAESNKTLLFAQRAKKVPTHAHINEVRALLGMRAAFTVTYRITEPASPTDDWGDGLAAAV